MGRLGARGARLAAVAAAALAGCGPAAGATQSWSGSFRLPAAAEPVAVSVQLTGTRATVALGPGHPGPATVPAQFRGGRLAFALRGRPARLVFAGSAHGRAISGLVTQGPLRGTFRLAPGRARLEPELGLYGDAFAIVKAEGYAPWLVDLRSGDVHGLGTSTVGTLLGDTAGDGTFRAGPAGLTWTHGGSTESFAHTAVRQEEVRFGPLAGTLTLPPGPGPFPAAVGVHGSGPTDRTQFEVFEALLVAHGIAFLAYDKRGIGQSGGVYPGERATATTVDVLASDAAAGIRFLAAQPDIDPTRIGLLGVSQGGWISALAAAREPAVRWTLLLVGPTVTVGESDYWGSLAGQGKAPPAEPLDRIEAEVRAAGPSGFDPAPALRQLTIPAFWIYGSDDRNVPTALCVEALERLQPGHDFGWTVIPGMTHAPFDLQDGLISSLPRSRGFSPGVFAAMVDWLRSRGVGQ